MRKTLIVLIACAFGSAIAAAWTADISLGTAWVWTTIIFACTSWTWVYLEINTYEGDQLLMYLNRLERRLEKIEKGSAE